MERIKHYKKISILINVLIVLTLILTACSSFQNDSASKNASSTTEIAMEDNLYAYEAADITEAGYEMEGAVLSDLNRTKTTASQSSNDTKLIKSVNISLQTKELDSLLEELKAYVTEYEGYIEYSNIYGIGLENLRSGNLTVRIPVENLETFMEKAKEAGTVRSISESTIDVTLEYVDVENHKKALEIEQERLYEILEQAKTVEELIAVEERLSQVRYELEWYTSSLNTYDNQINYSTVEIYFEEVERISKTETEGIWEQIKNKLGDSIYSIRNGARTFIVWFAGSIPYFLILAVIVVVVTVVVMKKKKRRRKNNNKEETN